MTYKTLFLLAESLVSKEITSIAIICKAMKCLSRSIIFIWKSEKHSKIWNAILKDI